MTAGCVLSPLQRDYLAAWLALCRPLAAAGAAAAVGHAKGASTAAAAAAVDAGSRQGDTRERVTAEAIRVGTAVVNKYKGCVAGVGHPPAVQL